MEIITKEFQDYEIRTILIDGEPWFVAKDIAIALDYPKSSIKSLTNLIKPIPEEWKGLNPVQTLGGNQKLQTLSEQGLYFFIARSDKPKAIPFQKWIAKDVLPQIRKTGSYSISNSQPKISLKLETENLILASEQYEALEKVFKKFGNLSKRELAEKTSHSVFKKTGIDFLKMYGGFQKEVEKPKYSFKNSFSLTSLLEKNNIQIQTSKFNLELEKLGIIERYGKSWKILDLQFGINEDYRNDNNPKYFEETFEELLNLVYPPKEFCRMPTI